MKNTVLLIICLLILNSCKSSKQPINETSRTLHTSDFISLTVPRIYKGTINYLDSTDLKMKSKNVDDVEHNNTLLPSLSDLSSSVTVYEVNNEGTLSLLGNTATKKGSNYVVIYDFTQAQTIIKKNTQQNDSIKQSIGISIRMIAEVKTNKNEIDITDLFKIGLNLKNEKIEGTLAVRAIGVSSQKINQVIPTTTDLSPASIATALQSIATIKSHIYDNDTRITPYLIGISIPAKSTSQEAQNQLNNFNL